MPVEVHLSSMDGKVEVKMNTLTTNRVTGSMKAFDWNKYQHKWSHLSSIEFPRLGDRPLIDMLIGIDYADLHCAIHEVRGEPGQPIARLTPLGWTCVGMTSQREPTTLLTYFCHNDEDDKGADINCTLKRFWDIESCKTTEGYEMSIEDRMLIDQTLSTIQYSSSSKRYQVEIPWKASASELSDNYEMAFRRLEATERRLKKDIHVAAAYCDNIDQYIEKGYIYKVASDQSKNKWYLPHFAIVKPEKTTSKTRIVFDASAAYKGISLNDVIHQGPKLQRELIDVLLVCDISEMYLQVEISPKDRAFFRFLWRELNLEKQPDVYEFSRVVFGVNCSPFLAQLVVQENARNLSTEFPAASNTVLKSTYMDDSMDSVSTVSKAIELYHQLSSFYQKLGMKTRKWMSNSEAVLKNVPPADRATEIEIESDSVNGAKTLGVLWSADHDYFTFRAKTPEHEFVYTKRVLLQQIASLFDPLGFLAPYVLRAKVLMQKVWLSGIEWDDLLDTELKSEAAQWLRELNDVNQITVPRCLRSVDCEKLKSMELHVFADASVDAYAAVAYTRCMYQNDYVSSHFVCSKTKVAPLESMSIPRLELMAAILALRIGMSVAKTLEIKTSDVHLWSDSMNVLCWIRNRSRIFKTFVANRIGEIQSTTIPDQWRHVPTKLNPADIASRGCSISHLVKADLWWNGPEFLIMSSENWPDQAYSATNRTDCLAAEMKQKYCKPVTLVTSVITDKLIDSDHYSDWTRLTRVQAWVLRFINNTRLIKSVRIQGELNVDEIRDAEMIIIKSCQQEAFADEYIALMKKKTIPIKSNLRVLNPRLDEDGIIRSDSRLVNSEHLPFETRDIRLFYHENMV